MKLDYRRHFLRGLASWLGALLAFGHSAVDHAFVSSTRPAGQTPRDPLTPRPCPQIRPPTHSVTRRG
jgi:hypothetical protein